ncbi:acyltransferase [uncultured Maribacter sp.]|uniref:acyltransferase family protein n=1 Tax=uncultured Maribacter sp. TaxID=431308 RepID=UPI002610EF38|nr:acyltransferase [uncultured Maribacter sp.]
MTKKKFLWSFHYFRAFAILNIILIHTWRFPPNSSYELGSNFVDTTRDMLFHGSTIYFLFISGFLFHYLSKKFSTYTYYLGKFKNVVLPYLFISICFILMEDFIGVKTSLSFNEYLLRLVDKLIKGTASFQFWYIPFIILVFLISPFFLKIKKESFIKYIPILFLLPILGTRTSISITFWQFVYFLPAYLIGMYSSINYDYFIGLIKQYKNYIYATAIVSSIILLYVNHDLNYYNLFSPRESLVYIQKMSITFIFLNIFKNISSNKVPFLNLIANCSFALYFTHAFVDRHLKKIYFIADTYTVELLKIPLSIVYVLLLIFVNVLLCFIAKKILGKKSRYLLGY